MAGHLASLNGRWNIQVASVERPLAAAVQAFKPAIVILADDLPAGDVPAMCDLIRRVDDAYVGIIVIAQPYSGGLAPSQGRASSPDDFCAPELVDPELPARIASVFRIKQMADSLKATNEKLRRANARLSKMTMTDDLSKLYNMRYFNKRLQQEFARSCRYQLKLSLIIFDVDDFKLVNDRCDHLMGSFVLAEMGKIVTRSIRLADIAARFGGDEYVILLPETTRNGARSLGERMVEDVKEHVFDNGIYREKISVSMGIVTFDGREHHQTEDSVSLLRHADEFLYEAKGRGRGLVVDQSNTTRVPATPKQG